MVLTCKSVSSLSGPLPATAELLRMRHPCQSSLSWTDWVWPPSLGWEFRSCLPARDQASLPARQSSEGRMCDTLCALHTHTQLACSRTRVQPWPQSPCSSCVAMSQTLGILPPLVRDTGQHFQPDCWISHRPKEALVAPGLHLYSFHSRELRARAECEANRTGQTTAQMKR